MDTDQRRIPTTVMCVSLWRLIDFASRRKNKKFQGVMTKLFSKVEVDLSKVPLNVGQESHIFKSSYPGETKLYLNIDWF